MSESQIRVLFDDVALFSWFGFVVLLIWFFAV